MDDTEFLSYCDSHAETPRCGFVPAQIARLLRLANYVHAAEQWEMVSNRVVDCNEEDIKKLVREARDYSKTKASDGKH